MKSYSDNKVLQVLAVMGDLMLLNVLWLLCSLPVITAGASTTALYYTTLKMVRKKESYPAKMFLHAFRQNLKQGIWMTLLLILLCIVLYVDLNISRNTSITLGPLLSFLLLALFCVFAMVASYLFPLQAQFETPSGGPSRMRCL